MAEQVQSGEKSSGCASLHAGPQWEDLCGEGGWRTKSSSWLDMLYPECKKEKCASFEKLYS